MRRLIAFTCEGAELLGTLDEAPAPTGLLIVSGGNEIRVGAHRGMALLAQRLAAQGTPVFRYDRRGVGDSEGENTGFDGSRADLIAAAAAFRREAPHLSRIVGFGNCDAASALALYGRDAGIDAVLLANPWVVEPADDLPPPAAIRARYAERLCDPRAWLRLLRGGVNLARLVRGLRSIATTRSEAPLTRRVLEAIGGWHGHARIILATGDATAIAYADAARTAGLAFPTTEIATASHSFARPADADALATAIRTALT